MFICEDCGRTFEDFEAVREEYDPSDKGVGLTPGSETYVYCPHCGSERCKENFNLIDCVSEGEDELSVEIEVGDQKIEVYLDDDGKLQVKK